MMDLQNIRCALQSADEEVRRSALRSLRDVACHEEIPALLSLLFTAMGDESWRVRKEAVERFVCLQPDLVSIEQLLNLLRNEDNAGLRNSAAEAVIRLGSGSASLLITMTRDPDADVRKFVIDVMGAIGDTVFVPALLSALNDPEVNVASAAAEQLGVLGDSRAAEHIMQSILSRDEILFRFSALGALEVLGKPAPVPKALLELAGQDVLRKAVITCLGSISDESSVTLLLDCFSCRQKNSRAAAVKSLFKIYGRSSSSSQERIREVLTSLKESDIIPGLAELFDHRDSELTEALLWTSVETGDTRFIPVLIEAFTEERTACGALLALKHFGRDALTGCVSRYSSLDESARTGLIVLIAECGYAGFNDIIRLALRDQSAQVRKAAAIAVGKLGLVSFMPELIQLIDDCEPHVYAAAVSCLQSLAMVSRSTVLAEVDMLYSSHVSHYRKAAAMVLASLGDRDRLLLLIKDEDPLVRKTAVSAIGSNRIDTAGSVLVSALADEDPDVRIAVAEALANVRDTSALDTLELALNDQDVWVQSAVLHAIAGIDQARAISIIKNRYLGTKGFLMISMLQILEKIGGSESTDIIRSALGSGDRDIARQAAKSLEHVSVSRSDR